MYFDNWIRSTNKEKKKKYVKKKKTLLRIIKKSSIVNFYFCISPNKKITREIMDSKLEWQGQGRGQEEGPGQKQGQKQGEGGQRNVLGNL